MANMFSGGEKREVPKSFDDCLKPDNVSSNLWVWGQRIETFGKIIFVLLIIAGLIISIAISVTKKEATYSWQSDKTVFEYKTFFQSLLRYAIYAFVEYITYHVLALLICSLASIVQNTRIAADVALYDSFNKSVERTNDSLRSSNNFDNSSNSNSPDNYTSSNRITSKYVTKVACPQCKYEQSADRAICLNCGAKLEKSNPVIQLGDKCFKCEKCRTRYVSEFCPFCKSAERTETEKEPDSWICSGCGRVNISSAEKCPICGRKKV